MANDYVTNLMATRDNAAATLAAITASPKPSYNVHGHAVSWTEYQKMLLEQIAQCNLLIAQGTPFEFVTVAK